MLVGEGCSSDDDRFMETTVRYPL